MKTYNCLRYNTQILLSCSYVKARVRNGTLNLVVYIVKFVEKWCTVMPLGAKMIVARSWWEADEKVSYYRLPSNRKLKKIWLEKIWRPESNLPPYENIRLCHLHFEKSCFERDLKSELLNLPIKKILKKTLYLLYLIITRKHQSEIPWYHYMSRQQI